MVNKYKNLHQLIFIQKQYRLFQSSIKTTKELLHNRKIIVYKPPVTDIIIHHSKNNDFTFHREKI
jgi:hypothetical protein